MQNTNGKTALGLDNNVGALICYLGNLVCALGLIYSIIVLVTDKTNKLPRFHAFQSILLSAVSIIVAMVFGMVFGVAAASRSGILSGLGGLIYAVFALALLGAIIFCCIKAYQGEIFKLPVIGDLADKWSN
ncbi:MAG: DUF4870 domain-containing protein [Acidobacteria bacterium]|nr:DUF4870 domain-containing protein [Acidobacteriota bacterium]MBA3786224.1 DUF4870 domain-containing protein [Acidobacteriota bacterium]